MVSASVAEDRSVDVADAAVQALLDRVALIFLDESHTLVWRLERLQKA